MIDSSRPKILVVDDAGPVVILCVNVLQALGYAIRAANRGETALDLCRKESFDLLVVDYKMPGLNGVEVVRRVRAARPEQRVVMITGHGTAEVIAEATEVRVNGLLFKPFTPNELVEATVAALKP